MIKRVNISGKIFHISFILTAICAIIISLADVFDWFSVLPKDVLSLFKIIFILLGIFMAESAYQSSSQEKLILKQFDIINRLYEGKFSVEEFEKTEQGVEYLTRKIDAAKVNIYQASLSTRLNRKPKTNKKFEQMVREVAIKETIKFHYIANFEDDVRLDRVKDITSNPKTCNFFVKYFNPESVVHPLNFTIIDETELIISIPSVLGDDDKFIAIRDTIILTAFCKYFWLLWSKALDYKPTEKTNYGKRKIT